MRLLIDIPEEEYIKICDEPCTELALAVRNGTPLDRLIADLESLREPTEPHLVDYRYHRNDMLDMVLGVIEMYK